MTVDQFANQIYELIVNTNSGKLILFNNEILSSLFNKKTSSCLFVLKAARPNTILKVDDNAYEITLDEQKLSIRAIKQLIEKMIKLEYI